jgi:hypothetical protein
MRLYALPELLTKALFPLLLLLLLFGVQSGAFRPHRPLSQNTAGGL